MLLIMGDLLWTDIFEYTSYFVRDDHDQNVDVLNPQTGTSYGKRPNLHWKLLSTIGTSYYDPTK
jgi:hypothetical protein